MNVKLIAPDLGSLEDEGPDTPQLPPRPDLRASPRRPEPRVEGLVRPGFVTEAPLPPEPTEPNEVLTIEVPRRLKRALQAEVGARKDDPDRRGNASIKSGLFEAFAPKGVRELFFQNDI